MWLSHSQQPLPFGLDIHDDAADYDDDEYDDNYDDGIMCASHSQRC